MKEKITDRFNELVKAAQPLLVQVNNTHHRDMLSLLRRQRANYMEWMNSVDNLLSVICKKDSNYVLQSSKILESITSRLLLDDTHVTQMYGLLCSAQNEWNQELLTEIEYIYVAESFDDFLDHSDKYHKDKKVMESSVLASAVLEDTMKKIALKNSLNSKQSLDPLIDELVKNNIFTKIQAKRVKAYTGVRNSALHANWSDININDVGEMIRGIRELIKDFLA